MSRAIMANYHFPKVIIAGKELQGVTYIEPRYFLNNLITVTITVYPTKINQDEIHLETQ